MVAMKKDFFKGKRVFVTGHTGFKGSWLCRLLAMRGAIVTGYFLEALSHAPLFELSRVEKTMVSVIGDIRNKENLQAVFHNAKPELVIHMAAQPLVLESYKNPAYTYETNVMGTVNIMECVRNSSTVKSFLNVTTDKVYMNNEWDWGYREIDPLKGYDPYSNSKACSDLITQSYRDAFLTEKQLPVSTARAGNVLGGGDFSPDRIIPDCFRGAVEGKTIFLRNPHSIRPYQHVLEPLFAYLMILEKQYTNLELAGSYNVGPSDNDCVSTGRLANLFCEAWGEGLSWKAGKAEPFHEASFLKLDCSKIHNQLDWTPNWNIKEAIGETVEWYKAYQNNYNIAALMDEQIVKYMRKVENL